jgi:hypothetical protein
LFHGGRENTPRPAAGATPTAPAVFQGLENKADVFPKVGRKQAVAVQTLKKVGEKIQGLEIIRA